LTPKGTLGIYSAEKTEHTKEFTTVTGKVKHFEEFDSIDGIIEGLYHFQENVNYSGVEEVAERFCLKLRNDEQLEVLTCDINNAKTFIARIENIDFSKPIVLKCFKMKNESGKDVQYMIPHQDNVKIDNAYSKESEKSLPMGEKVKVGKKEVWDFSELTNALIEIVNSHEVKK
jgi:hypothetical protein